MKTLFIIRHAKSDQHFFGNDFERPLNEKGKRDAPLMAKRLKKYQDQVDIFISSPATRAKQTALIFAKEFNITDEEIIYIPSLYHASPDIFYEVIAELPDNINSVAVFSHNPGITYFINELTGSHQINNMPACAVYAVSADIVHWSEFKKSTKEYLFFDHPKLIV